jgi:Dyp-type peroxidase family
VAAAPVTIDLGDVQGLVARGYGTLGAAAFLLLGLEDGAAARRWLGSVLESVTSGEDRPEGRAVNVAFTSLGLLRLGLEDEVLQQFSNEFVHGMTTEHRRRALGDVGDSAPEEWDWGGPTTDPVGAVLLLYARDTSELAGLLEEHSRLLVEAGVEVQRKLDTSDLDGFEPFGFRDGISQPFVEGLSKSGPPGQTVRAGEFVLGYVNEHGHLTDEPLLETIGRNGSYLVFRQLEQDVRGFWRYIDSAAPHPAERTRLAAKMVGRWPGGAPLTLSPDRDDPALAEANDFGYFHEDPVGTGCPVGAHVRRTNPRDSLDPGPGTDKSLAINRRHRLLRRGREYGQALSPEAALTESLAADEQRGLHFICLNGNIARQFEFVQNTWLNNPKFAGLYDDSDPLVGQSEPYGGTFTMPSATVRRRVTGMPRFIKVRGGAYFFLPGLTALRRLAST